MARRTQGAAERISVAQGRRILIAAQGLGTPGAKLGPTLERTGFVRTLGGVEAYIALRARVAGLTAGDVHAAIEGGVARVMPAVRGCMYLVAASQVPAALRFAAALSEARINKEAAAAGIPAGELDTLGAAVLKCLRKGPLGTDGLRKALPAGSVRSLGEKGKKLGVSSPLPGALRLLELGGRIERTPEGARLDTERYLWRATGKPAVKPAKDAASALPAIAEIFLRAAGLGAIKDLAAWAGVAQRDAAAAVAKLDVVPVEIEGQAEARLMLPEARTLLDADIDRAVALLPFEDNLLALPTPGLMIDPAHHAIEVPTWGSNKRSALGDARHLSHRTVVAESKIVGFWELDPDAGAVVVGYFDSVSLATKKRVQAAAGELGHFLVKDIGHGRSFSLDTDDELRLRVKWLRQAF